MLNLIPRPQNWEENNGSFDVPSCISVDMGGFPLRCVNAYLQRSGLPLSQEHPWLTLEKDETLPKEGYKLTVTPSGVHAAAAEDTGIIWALTSLFALQDGGSVPCGTLLDAPRFCHRGLSLDCARHFFPAEQVKKIIEGISLAKINVLHWHLADDQGWRIESKVFPLLHETSGMYYTQQEIREVVAFAQDRGVQIIPEIDMPGHTSAILAAYPDLSCSGKQVALAKTGGIYPIILCPGKEETFSFAERLLEELIPLFPGGRFHIGGDEAPKSEWKKCPHCAARMKQLGLTQVEDLQGYFTERMVRILKKHGKTAICWNESLLASTCPQDIQIQYWTLQHRKSMEAYAKKGGQFIYSDMFELYFDYPHSMTPLKKVYHTLPHFGDTLIGNPENMLGLEACLWAEQVEDGQRLENLIFPRILAVAEITWRGAGRYEDFKNRLTAWRDSPMNRELRFTQRQWYDPRGKARREEALAFFSVMTGGMPEEVRQQTMDAAAPGKEYVTSFVRKFMRPWDIPSLLSILLKK